MVKVRMSERIGLRVFVVAARVRVMFRTMVDVMGLMRLG